MVNIYNIPANKSFLDTLAISLLKKTENSPDKLQNYLLLMPTKRACLSLREAFLNHSKEKALILPQIQPIGTFSQEDNLLWLNQDPEIENKIPPPISSMKRLMVLSKLVMKKAKSQGINMSPHTSVILGKELGSLFDEVLIENLSWDNLNKIIPDNLNTYWQDILTFLEIISVTYPNYLKEQGLSDVKEYELYKIKQISELWKKSPPTKKIIAAGNTASQPVIADLLKVIANLENGTVILPGLDRQSTDEEFYKFKEGHYQYSLKRFLENIGITRNEVQEWDIEKENSQDDNEKLRLVTESLKPTELTQNWNKIEPLSENCLNNIYKCEADDDRQEALIIALIMRKTLETQGKTAALVTTDVNLGKRVSLELERFGIKINNSAGLSLNATPVGVFFNLILGFCLNPSPITLLALLKHPLTGAGQGENCRNIARAFEKELRGKAHVYSIKDIKTTLSEDLSKTFEEIVSLLNPLLELSEKETSVQDILKIHIECAKAFAKNVTDLWKGPSGKSISGLFLQLIENGDDFIEINLTDYEKLLLQFQRQELVRNPYNSHKRLEILGPMESRLQHKDVIIIGGLNEGIFPKTEDTGPWMSYQMREEFELPSIRQRIGISASDFNNCFMAKEVYLTRSLKSEGVPTISSRWLQRLEAVLSIAGQTAKEKSSWGKTIWQEYAHLIDLPENTTKLSPIFANPDISSRPKEISATGLELLIKDPYSFYVKYILRIKPEEDLEPLISHREYGNAVHEVFAWFVENHKDLPENSIELIIKKAEEEFKKEGLSSYRFYQFIRSCDWFLRVLSNSGELDSYVEKKGFVHVNGIKLFAKADRVDVDEDGNSVIIDYKTGSPPSSNAVLAGYAPQLVIEALIAMAGGFEEIDATSPISLEYYRISGRKGASKIHYIKPEKPASLAEVIEKGKKGIEDLLKAFYEQGIPYEARPDPLIEFRYSEYEHLERLKEWSFINEVEG